MAISATSPAALPPDQRLFLGVERSACGRAWRDRLDARGDARALAIVQRHGLPELLARVIAGRGIESDEVTAFLDPTLKRLLPDPYGLTDMAAAAERLADAVTRREQIAIFGDYDVDGATSTALLASFCALRSRSARPYSRPHLRGLRPEHRRHPALGRARRAALGDGRLRHHQP